jgi:hypothetical protein
MSVVFGSPFELKAFARTIGGDAAPEAGGGPASGVIGVIVSFLPSEALVLSGLLI